MLPSDLGCVTGFSVEQESGCFRFWMITFYSVAQIQGNELPFLFLISRTWVKLCEKEGAVQIK